MAGELYVSSDSRVVLQFTGERETVSQSGIFTDSVTNQKLGTCSKCGTVLADNSNRETDEDRSDSYPLTCIFCSQMVDKPPASTDSEDKPPATTNSEDKPPGSTNNDLCLQVETTMAGDATESVTQSKTTSQAPDTSPTKSKGSGFQTTSTFSEDLKSVSTISSGKKNYQCPICKKKVVGHLTRHVLTHSTDKTEKCPICKKAFVQKEYLQSHMKLHEEVKPHACNMCDKSFALASFLKKHQRSHQTEKPHKCSLCDRSYKKENHLKRHMANGHKLTAGMLCVSCAEVFTSQQLLIQHQLSHAQCSPYSCKSCDKRFTDKAELDRHKIEHTGGGRVRKPVTVSLPKIQVDIPCSVCSVCGGDCIGTCPAVQPGRCSTYPRSKCKQCGKSFRKATQLIGHICKNRKGVNH